MQSRTARVPPGDLPPVLQAPIPKETKATCDDCVMYEHSTGLMAFGRNRRRLRRRLDTAAIMKTLDLVITSDTAVPHLAGALGVPVWVALSAAADWRYMLHRQDSPWYPTMRLFRQTEPGNWEGVFERMAEELELHPRRQADF